MKKTSLTRNHSSGGNTGPSQPPKNSVTIIAEMRRMPRYSPTKNMPNFMPEYSVWKPAISSFSASGRSNGRRCVSAMPAMRKMTKPEELRDDVPQPRWARTMSLRSNEPAISTTPTSDSPMKTS